jgi:hypothetical protein
LKKLRSSSIFVKYRSSSIYGGLD